jgi:hypothetical protein
VKPGLVPDSGAERIDGHFEFIGAAVPGEHAPGSDVEQLNHAINGSRLVVRELESKRVELTKDQRLTPVGQREKLGEFALQESLQRLRKLRSLVGPRVTRFNERIAALKPFPPRQRDDLVGELRDRELRDFVRSLPPEERRKAVREGSEELKRAVLAAPAELSGLRSDMYAALHGEAIEAAHGDALDELRALDEATRRATSALDRAEAAVRRASGLRSSEGS